MPISRNKKIAVTLTVAQWEAVCEAIGFAQAGSMADRALDEKIAADRRAWDNTGKAQDLINDALDRAGREEEG